MAFRIVRWKGADELRRRNSEGWGLTQQPRLGANTSAGITVTGVNGRS